MGLRTLNPGQNQHRTDGVAMRKVPRREMRRVPWFILFIHMGSLVTYFVNPNSTAPPMPPAHSGC